jgi:oligoendopeptidase F
MPANKFYQVETESKVIPERDEINQEYKWNLTDIFQNDEEWENEFKSVSEKVTGYQKYEGNLSESSENLLACFQFDENINIKLGQLHLYAMLSKDSDMRVGKYHSMDDRIQSLYAQVGAASSFIRPELLKIPEERLRSMIDSNEALKIYKHSLEDLLRSKKHTLSNSEEKILAMAAELTQTPYNTFSIFTNADLKLPTIKDELGEMTELSHGRYYSAMYSKDRDYRARVFKAYLESYKIISTLSLYYLTEILNKYF